MTLVDDRPASAGEPRQSRRARFGRGSAAGERVRQPLTPRMRRRRRRLLLASLPVVVLAVLVALKLLSLNLVHSQTLAAYQEGDKAGTMTWGERQGWVNIVEQFRSPFAIGDAHLLTGHYDLARPWFEQAFEQVPKGGIDDCKVRVNLGLTYEALGDAAKARERTDEWRQYYDKGIKITSERPPLCDLPEGQRTGDQLQQAQQRMQEKNSDTPAPDQQQEQGPQAGPADPAQPTPDPGNTPSQEEQDYLQEQQRQNTIERNQQQGNDDRTAPDGGSDTYPKPW
ncbi:hypothetical protein GCM10027053_04840 [Intrasporangium mesophilum]